MKAERKSVTTTERKPTESARPSISAVLPLKNGERYVAECLRSIDAQTLGVTEIIVVDDGCDDESLAVVKSVAATMTTPLIVVVGEGIGQSAARNRGVLAATGDLIALIDQDDIWMPRHVERLARELEIHSGSQLTYSDFTIIDEHGSLVSTHYNVRLGNSHPKESVLEIIREDVFALPSCMMFRRQAFLDLGGFNPELQGFEDDEFYLRAFQSAWAPVYVAESLTHYRTHREANSRSASFWRSRVRYAHIIANAFPDDPWTRRFWLRDIVLPRFRYSIMLDYSAAISLRHRAAASELASSFSDLIRATTELTLKLRLGMWVLGRPVLARILLRSYFRRLARK
jgi:glycosyltransferase involved in cell wall biosynthesis